MTVGPSIDDATLAYVRTILAPLPGNSQTDRSQHLPAAQALEAAFNRWNPENPFDIKVRDMPAIDCIFFIESVDNNTSSVLTRIKNKIESIAQALVKICNECTESKEKMQQLLPVLQARTWETYYTKQNITFPTADELQAKIDDMDQYPTLIQQYTTIEIHGQLFTLKDLCSKYKIPESVRLQGYYNLQYILDESNPRTQLELLRVVFGSTNNSNILYLWAYFSLYQSLLFGEPIPSSSRDVTNAVSAIKEKSTKILNVFGPSMNYTSVVNALQVLNTNDLINKEITILLNCEELQITAKDVTNFRAVQLLYDLEKPLQGFIAGCANYKFHVVMNDTSFLTLKHAVQVFYSKEYIKDCQICLIFVDQLFTLLCQAPIATIQAPHVSLLSKIYELKKVLAKALVPVSFVSDGPNVWTFFNEMKWFNDNVDEVNDEGLQRYYEKNDIVISILNEYEATNELLIIDTLTPVVRFYNCIEQNIFCSSLKELIFNLMQDKDMNDLLKQHQDMTAKTTIQKSIYELNSRIVSVKDLFHGIYRIE